MKIFQKISKQFSTGPGNDVYILSAVRTPIGFVNGSLSDCTGSELGAIAIKEALERARVPAEDVKKTFVGQSSLNNFREHLAQNVFGLSILKTVNLVPASGLQNVVQAFHFLKTQKKSVCAVTEMESLSNSPLPENYYKPKVFAGKSIRDPECNLEEQKNYFVQDYKNLMKAYKSGIFQEETAKIIIKKKKGVASAITEDEQFQKLEDNFTVKKNGLNFMKAAGDGAAACILATGDYVNENVLNPLAKVIGGSDEIVSSQDLLFAQINVIKKVMKVCNCDLSDISQWEIDDFYSNMSLKCMKHLKINHALLNVHGGSLSLACPIEVSGARIFCHLVHSLSEGKLGLATACNTNGTASAVILKKLGSENNGKPQLTLYTKYPCHLCDELKEQLQSFKGRYTLKEVNIESNEYEKFKKLYCYEIPVLFLDGRFLCKHKLDVEYFNQRLIRTQRNICTESKV